jgi:lycopene cyclase domain-containing protein
MTYTQLCVVAVLASAVLDLVLLRTRLLARRAFWVAYAIILFFQLLTNGWLTGLGVVRYDADALLGGDQARLVGGGRLLYAPVEDIAFGFALVLQTLSWWVFWGRRGVQRTASPAGRDGPGEPGQGNGRAAATGHADP